MKRIVYFLIFTLVRCIVASIVNSTRPAEPKGNVSCTYEESETYYTAICNKTKFFDAVIPDNLITTITQFELHTDRAGDPWLITKLDTFTRFSQLSTLSIYSSLDFTQEMVNLKEKLFAQLFNIPTVEKFLIGHRCAFLKVPRNSTWVLPPNLVKFSSINCDIQFFDWTKPTKLKHVDLHDSSLSKIPTFGHPTIEELDIRTSGQVITIDEMAHLCKLTIFLFDDGILSTPHVFCECERYKAWQQYLLTEEHLSLEYQTGEKFHCVAGAIESNCSDYTLDNAKKNRASCLKVLSKMENKSRNPIELPTNSSFFHKIPFWVYVIIVSVVFIALIFTLIIMVVNRIAPQLNNEEGEEEEE